MAVQIGHPAPDFALKRKTETGIETVHLQDYRGQTVVLLFFPMAFTDVCTQEMCTVSNEYQQYASLGAAVLGISVDSPFAQEAWAKQNGITIPLLSDFNREVCRAYGACYDNFFPGVLDFQGVAKRSAFVIDAQGIVRYAEVLEDATQLPDFQRIREVVEDLKEATQ